jgi:predicted ATPase
VRLRLVRLLRYRQFIDQILKVDSSVTVVVGRNDTGKTGLLRQFFDQCVFESVIASGDRSQVPGHQNARTHWSVMWDVEKGDDRFFPLLEAFGTSEVNTIELEFEEQATPAKYWIYKVNGQVIDAYEGLSEDGQPIRRAVLAARRLFPRPHYMSINRLLMTMFEARFFDIPHDPQSMFARPTAATPESSLLRLAGLSAETRPIPGNDTPWEGHPFPRSQLTLDMLEQHLETVSSRLTEKLRSTWVDPPDVQVTVKLAGGQDGKAASHRRNSYTVVAQVTDYAGLPLQGTGLLWFLTFIVELELLHDYPHPLLLLIDEPATPLHPSGQRAVARLLGALASRFQIIYSTHSPFMIDWNFPQRVRMMRRDPSSRRTTIENAPYHSVSVERIWDPLREAIGITLGDVAVIGESNVLVEGIVDQVLLANASSLLAAFGDSHLDLERVSIIPYGSEPVLEHLLALIHFQGAKVVVLADADQQGDKVRKLCTRENVAVLTIDSFASHTGKTFAIEDTIPIDLYIAQVNDLYEQFAWFTPLNSQEVVAQLDQRSLAKYLEDMFAERFGQSFSKRAVSVLLAERMPSLGIKALGRLPAVVKACLESLQP